MFETGIKIIDGATKHVEKQAKAAAKAHGSALAAASYRLKQLTTEGMRKQAPGDVIWPPVHPWTRMGTLGKAKRAYERARGKGKKRRQVTRMSLSGDKKPLSRLAGAVRYEKQGGDNAEVRVRVGFLTAKVAQRAAYHAEEHTIPVTEKMRRKIFAAGLMIFATSIRIPKREHVGAVYRRNHAKISGFAEKRVQAAWAGRDPKGIQPPF